MSNENRLMVFQYAFTNQEFQNVDKLTVSKPPAHMLIFTAVAVTPDQASQTFQNPEAFALRLRMEQWSDVAEVILTAGQLKDLEVMYPEDPSRGFALAVDEKVFKLVITPTHYKPLVTIGFETEKTKRQGQNTVVASMSVTESSVVDNFMLNLDRTIATLSQIAEEHLDPEAYLPIPETTKINDF